VFGGGDGGKGLCERVVALCTRGIGRAGSHDSPMEGWHQQRVYSGYVKGVWKAFGCQKSCTTSMHCLRNWKSPPRQKVTMNMFSISPDRADFTSSSLLPALSANEYLVCQSSQPPQLNRPSPSPCLWDRVYRVDPDDSLRDQPWDAQLQIVLWLLVASSRGAKIAALHCCLVGQVSGKVYCGRSLRDARPDGGRLFRFAKYCYRNLW
jgi:hypothetical protein